MTHSYLYDAVRYVRFIPLNYDGTGAERTCLDIDWSATWSYKHRYSHRYTDTHRHTDKDTQTYLCMLIFSFGCSLQPPLTRAKPLFFGQKQNFSGRSQQPKTKKIIFVIFFTFFIFVV